MMAIKPSRFLPVVGLAIFAYLVLSAGIGNIVSVFLLLNPFYLAIACVLVIVNFSLQNLKWKMILSGQRIDIGYKKLYKIYMIGAFYGFITPGKIGTFLRVKYIQKCTGKSLGECSVNLVVERIIDMLVLFLLAIAGLVYLVNFISPSLLVLILAAFAVFGAFVVILLRENTSRKLLKIFWKVLVPKSMKGELREAFNSFFKNMIHVRALVVPSLISLAAWVSIYSASYMAALSIGIDVPFTAILTIQPLATIVALIPITVGGWGTREAVWLFLFSFYGVLAQQVMALSILSGLVTYIIPAAVGGVLSLTEERNK